MQGKIGLEEHFAIPDTLSDSKGFLADATWPELESRLMDLQERRIREISGFRAGKEQAGRSRCMQDPR